MEPSRLACVSACDLGSDNWHTVHVLSCDEHVACSPCCCLSACAHVASLCLRAALAQYGVHAFIYPSEDLNLHGRLCGCRRLAVPRPSADQGRQAGGS
jgi:hypothetical protein